MKLNTNFYLQFIFVFFIVVLQFSCSYKRKISAQNIKISPYYSSNMVFQEDNPIRITGSCNPNQTLAIRLENTLKFTNSDQSGNWQVEFPPVNYKNSFDVYIEGVSEEIKLSNVSVGKVIVLIGDVWLKDKVINLEEKVQNNEENLFVRYFQPEFSYNDGSGFNAEWKVLSRGKSNKNEVFARILGQQIYDKKSSAIGIINLVWPGMDIREFDAKERQKAEAINPLVRDSLWIGYFQSQKKVEFLSDSSFKAIEKGVFDRSFKDNDWPEIDLPIVAYKHRYLDNRIIWFRKRISIPDKFVSSHFKLQIEKMYGNFDFYFNGIKLDKTSQGNHNYNLQIPDSIVKVWSNLLTVRMVSEDSLTGIYSSNAVLINSDNSFKVPLNEKWKYRTFYEPVLPKSRRNYYLFPDVQEKWFSYLDLFKPEAVIVAGGMDFYKYAELNTIEVALTYIESKFSCENRYLFLLNSSGEIDSLVNSSLYNKLTNSQMLVSTSRNWKIINTIDVKRDKSLFLYYQELSKRYIELENNE